jgi:hypothetical protein
LHAHGSPARFETTARRDARCAAMLALDVRVIDNYD